METVRHAISNAFNTKTTKINYFQHQGFVKEDVKCNVIFKRHEIVSYIGKSFLKFKMKPGQPLFHSLYMDDIRNLDKFNQMFQFKSWTREQFLTINEFLKKFEANTNFLRFLKFTSLINPHEFYTFQKKVEGINVLTMLDKEMSHGITSCVNGSYRSVAEYSFIKNFAVTRDNKIVVFPTIKFTRHVKPFSLYFDLVNNIVYKLPLDLAGLSTVENIVEASCIFTDSDIDVFTDEILMSYVNNLHPDFYEEFLTIPKENLADKIDLLMMMAI